MARRLTNKEMEARCREIGADIRRVGVFRRNQQLNKASALIADIERRQYNISRWIRREHERVAV